jgi:EAL domain-containing protein (putative c-di-GMP-specific phosphodiesterase class I)
VIISLAEALGLKVIAEGIESEEQLRLLQSHGCDEGQGYLFARPSPATKIPALLEMAVLRAPVTN